MPLDPAVYARVFEGHREGALILEELVQVFTRSAKTEGGIDAILKTYHNAGSRAVIDWIVNRINRANGVNDDDAIELNPQ